MENNEETKMNITDVLANVAELENRVPEETSIEMIELNGDQIAERLLETIKNLGLEEFYNGILEMIQALSQRPFNVRYPSNPPDEHMKGSIMASIISGNREVVFMRHPKLVLSEIPGYHKWTHYCSRLSAMRKETPGLYEIADPEVYGFEDVVPHLSERGFATRKNWGGNSFIFWGVDNLAWFIHKSETSGNVIRRWDACLADIKANDWVPVELYWNGQATDFLPFEKMKDSSCI